MLSLRTLDFWPYFYTHLNSDLILSKTGILIPSFGIFALFLKTLEFLCYPSTADSGPSSPSKHWYAGPFFPNIGILILSFHTLDMWSYFYKLCDSGPILSNIGILTHYLYALVF